MAVVFFGTYELVVFAKNDEDSSQPFVDHLDFGCPFQSDWIKSFRSILANLISILSSLHFYFISNKLLQKRNVWIRLMEPNQFGCRNFSRIHNFSCATSCIGYENRVQIKIITHFIFQIKKKKNSKWKSNRTSRCCKMALSQQNCFSTTRIKKDEEKKRQFYCVLALMTCKNIFWEVFVFWFLRAGGAVFTIVHHLFGYNYYRGFVLAICFCFVGWVCTSRERESVWIIIGLCGIF